MCEREGEREIFIFYLIYFIYSFIHLAYLIIYSILFYSFIFNFSSFISVKQKDTRSGIIKSGKLVLVDLAGSEMVRKYGF